jgi:hypothetical protein
VHLGEFAKWVRTLGSYRSRRIEEASLAQKKV